MLLIIKSYTMFKKNSNALSNINCIDLLNASREELNNYCLVSNVANGFKLYLMHLHSSLHDDSLVAKSLPRPHNEWILCV